MNGDRTARIGQLVLDHFCVTQVLWYKKRESRQSRSSIFKVKFLKFYDNFNIPFFAVLS